MGMRLPPGTVRKILAASGGRTEPAPKRTAPAVVGMRSRWEVVLTVPLVVRSSANLREHWSARHRRVAAERAAVGVAFSCANLPSAPDFSRGAAVTLTRLGGRRWDDDNNVSGLKGCRDAVAKWLGCDDADPRVGWKYDQKPGGGRGVEITITGEG